MNNISDSSKDIIEQLLKRYSLLEILEKNCNIDTISASEKESYAQKCQNNYIQWNYFDSITKEFLISAEISLDKINISNIDFSFVSLEFCKAFENEILCKIFKPYIADVIDRQYGKLLYDWIDKETNKYKYSSGPLGDSIESVLSHGSINLTLGQMISYISDTNKKREIIRPLIKDFREYLQKYTNYQNLIQIKDSFDTFRINYRNHAAHTEYLNLTFAIKTKNEIPKKINELFTAINTRK